MGIAASLILFAVGAVLRFAVAVTTPGFNLHDIGVILMIVAAVGFFVSLAFWGTWGGFGHGASSSRVTTTEGPEGTTSSRTDERVRSL